LELLLLELHALIQAIRSYVLLPGRIADERFTLYWEQQAALSIICYPSSS